MTKNRQLAKASRDVCTSHWWRVVRYSLFIRSAAGRDVGTSRLDLVQSREPGYVVGGAERQCLNRHRRLPATRRHEARSIADEEVRHIVRAVVAIDDRVPRIVAHPRGPEQL